MSAPVDEPTKAICEYDEVGRFIYHTPACPVCGDRTTFHFDAIDIAALRYWESGKDFNRMFKHWRVERRVQLRTGLHRYCAAKEAS